MPLKTIPAGHDGYKAHRRRLRGAAEIRGIITIVGIFRRVPLTVRPYRAVPAATTAGFLRHASIPDCNPPDRADLPIPSRPAGKYRCHLRLRPPAGAQRDRMRDRLLARQPDEG